MIEKDKLIALEQKAVELKLVVLDMIYAAKTGHIGSDYSATTILVALYYYILQIDVRNPDASNRDRYIQSKGHAAEIYWAILADLGFIDSAELATYAQYASRLIGHPNNKVAGIEMNTGSLGHGLSVATGMAIAAKMDRLSYQNYVLLGDGELAEGSNWEAAMAAAHYKLDNLTAILDYNKLQITGTNSEVMGLEPLRAKWEAFGWEVHEVDGDNFRELITAFHTSTNQKPKIIIAHTIKAHGITIGENIPSWHHKIPTAEEYTIIKQDLQTQLKELGVNA